MIENKVYCDCTGKQLKGQEMVNMTVITIQQKIVDSFDVQIEGTKGKTEKKKFVKQVLNHQWHICEEHSLEFMEYMRKFFTKHNPKHRQG